MICALSPTGLIPWFSKTEGNTYATLLHHPFLFGENQRSAQEVARRISGPVARDVYAKVNIPSIHHIPLSPVLHYLPFASHFPLPHFTLAVLFALSFPISSLFRLPFVCSPSCLKLGRLSSIWTIMITWKILMLLLKNSLFYILKSF